MLNQFLRNIGLSLILISSAASSAYAQTADDLFNESAVQTLQITIFPRQAGAGSLGRPRWVGDADWSGAPV